MATVKSKRAGGGGAHPAHLARSVAVAPEHPRRVETRVRMAMVHTLENRTLAGDYLPARPHFPLVGLVGAA